MRRNSTPAMGALHPVLFFIFIYGISLFLALFVCRTVFHALNPAAEVAGSEETGKNLQYTAVRGEISAAYR